MTISALRWKTLRDRLGAVEFWEDPGSFDQYLRSKDHAASLEATSPPSPVPVARPGKYQRESGGRGTM